MCGIAGFVASDPQRPSGRGAVGAMLRALEGRGPDGEGLEEAAGGCLGHRRLAILDLSDAARQPFASEDGAVFSAVNGEIWNHRELRRELEARGHRFRSACDAEIVVHLYEEAGTGAVERLDGMFALAVWDARRRALLLARDRFGEKPLYYHAGPAGIAFASEIRALLASGAVSAAVDDAALRQFLFFRFVPAPATGFAGIHKVPPSHWLLWQDGRTTLRRWWAPPAPPERAMPDADRQTFSGAASELRRLLREAVRRRLESDVPLGLLLSGGLDSSAIAVEMAALCGNGFDTFSAGFAEEDYDETALAAAVARRVGSRHHVVRVAPDAAASLPRLVAQAGEPFADSSLVALEALARAVRPHVTVALGGDGGDEVLGGYDRYRAILLSGLLGPRAGRLAGSLLAAASAGGVLPGAAVGRRTMSGRAQRFVEALGRDPLEANAAWLACFDEAAIARLAPDGIGARPGASPDDRARDARVPDSESRAAEEGPFAVLKDAWPTTGTPLERVLYADLVRTLPDRMAFKLDIGTMSVALEARSPFLDRDLVEWAARLPGRFKVSPTRGKRLLRRAYRGELPGEVLHAPKAGFGLPVDRWLRGPLREMASDLLTGPSAVRSYAEPRAVAPLLEEHLSGRRNHDDRLWALLCLELWHRTFIDRGQAPTKVMGACPQSKEPVRG